MVDFLHITEETAFPEMAPVIFFKVLRHLTTPPSRRKSDSTWFESGQARFYWIFLLAKVMLWLPGMGLNLVDIWSLKLPCKKSNFLEGLML